MWDPTYIVLAAVLFAIPVFTFGGGMLYLKWQARKDSQKSAVSLCAWMPDFVRRITTHADDIGKTQQSTRGKIAVRQESSGTPVVGVQEKEEEEEEEEERRQEENVVPQLSYSVLDVQHKDEMKRKDQKMEALKLEIKRQNEEIEALKTR